MAKYNIPGSYLDGFSEIVRMSEDDFEKLINLLKSSKIAEPIENILDNGADVFKSISPAVFQDVLHSLLSIIGIFESSNYDVEKFSSDFSNSYLFSDKQATGEDVNTLRKRLVVLLNNIENLITTSKSEDLLTSNQRNFRESRIVSDVRMVFGQEMDNKSKYALIIHNLKIRYSESGKSREFFVSLDLADLKKIKYSIDRAIEKDRIIKETEHLFNFIDFRDASNSSD